MTVNAPSVQTRAAARGQRRTLIPRSAVISRGCTRKKAPQTREIGNLPMVMKGIITCATALAKKAVHKARAGPRRASGWKNNV
jgi:hypothetical protein